MRVCVCGGGAFRAQELCGSRGGRPGLPVPNSPYGLCGREATLNSNFWVHPFFFFFFFFFFEAVCGVLYRVFTRRRFLVGVITGVF